MKIVIVLLETLQIQYVYEAPEPSQGMYGGEWGSPQVTVHVAVPEDLDPDTVMAVLVDGQITLVEDPFKLAARTESLWSELRTKRNQLLAASDWTQLQDAHMSQERKDAWSQYRQALRDLPDEVQNPQDSVPWPSDPTVPVPVQSTGSRLSNILSQFQEPVEAETVVEVTEPVAEVTEAEPVAREPAVEVTEAA